MTDHFTRFSQAYATKNKSSTAAAAKIYNEFVLQFGFPTRIHSDQGPEFTSSLFKELHRLSGTKMSTTTPYHPMGNSQVERYNGIVWNTVKSFTTNNKIDIKHWESVLPQALHAVRSLLCTSTNQTPHERFFNFFLTSEKCSCLATQVRTFWPSTWIYRREAESKLPTSGLMEQDKV